MFVVKMPMLGDWADKYEPKPKAKSQLARGIREPGLECIIE